MRTVLKAFATSYFCIYNRIRSCYAVCISRNMWRMIWCHVLNVQFVESILYWAHIAPGLISHLGSYRTWAHIAPGLISHVIIILFFSVLANKLNFKVVRASLNLNLSTRAAKSSIYYFEH